MLADSGRTRGFFNSAVLLQPPPPAAWDDVPSHVERFYDAPGHGEAYLCSPWPTPDLHHRGWQLVGHPPLLAR